MYDSRPDTILHIARVRELLHMVLSDIGNRGRIHDGSKLIEPEISIFNEFTPKLRGSTYGSDEYKDNLASMSEGLTHHYMENRHHPEHFPGGISDMTLLDLVEMLVDWKAATERHENGDINRSLVLNAERFGIEGQLAGILANTVTDLFGEKHG